MQRTRGPPRPQAGTLWCVVATVSSLVSQFGYPAILLLMALESCGMPVPSEVVVPLGGLLASFGKLNLVMVTVVASIANVIGSLAAYGIAARWGSRALLGPGRYLGIRAHHVRIADRWFRRYGLLAVFFGRMLPIVRTYISFPAGLSRVGLGRFVLLTFVGALPWNFALAYAGYVLGAHYDRITIWFERGGYLVALLVVVAVAAWWWRGRRSED